jgi:hypothetical protein
MGLIACSDEQTHKAETTAANVQTQENLPEQAASEIPNIVTAGEITDPNSAAGKAAQRAINIKLPMPADIIVAHSARNARRNVYFGDLHVHTTYSFDAFAFGTTATPYDAYRYAKGEPIKHPGGFDVQLREPLDFYAVTDHAMFLGLAKEAADTSTEFSKLSYVEFLHNLNAPENVNIGTLPLRAKAFSSFLIATLFGLDDGNIDGKLVNNVVRSAWSDTIKAAEQFNKPGEFTTFVGYEFTSSTLDRGNLHRNVIFRGADKLPAMPFSRFHTTDPEGLWDWMDGLRAQGIETLAIPHNSNGSNGQMFKLVDWAGNPMDHVYTETRLRNEPLIEITQVKGTSETHPALSNTDEWADFAIMPYRIATRLPSEPKGSYAREALLNGLAFEDRGITNPYKFGFIGSSDTHTGATSDDETNYFAKVGLLDSTSALRGSTPISDETAALVNQTGRANVKEIGGRMYSLGSSETYGASGLAAVWAEENTREAIYDAFRRKETFATTGPRMKVRFFGGYGFDDTMLEDQDGISQAYAKGVSMGSNLLGDGETVPSFMAWAMRDVRSAALQRLQVVKGWTVNGEHFEKVYDVACSDGGKVDPLNHRCPDNGAKVNITDCSISADVGASALKTVWKDPEFNPNVRAFYYVRVLENPTCRWSTWDAIRAGVPPRPDLKKTIQERAFTSPIWYIPDSAKEQVVGSQVVGSK